MDKETESFTDSEGHEYNYDVFTLTLRSSELSTRKYILTTKYGTPIISITVQSTGFYRMHLTEQNTSYTHDTLRIVNEFITHILSLKETT